MKILAFSVLLMSAASCAWAEEDGGNFEQRKQRAVEMTGKRIDSLTKLKSCIQSSSNGDGIRACHEKNRDEMKSLGEANLNERISKLEERKKKLQEQKGKLGQPK